MCRAPSMEAGIAKQLTRGGRLSQLIIAVAVATSMAGLCGRAVAGIVVDIDQVGQVVRTASGIDRPQRSHPGRYRWSAVAPVGRGGLVSVGALSDDKVYTGISGPSSFGAGMDLFPNGQYRRRRWVRYRSELHRLRGPVLYSPRHDVFVRRFRALRPMHTTLPRCLTPGTYTFRERRRQHVYRVRRQRP